MFSSRLLTGGTAQRVGLMEGSLRFWGPQMSVPRPDLSPNPSAHLPPDVSSQVLLSVLCLSQLCTVSIHSHFSLFFPSLPRSPFLQGVFQDYLSYWGPDNPEPRQILGDQASRASGRHAVLSRLLCHCPEVLWLGSTLLVGGVRDKRWRAGVLRSH